MANQLGMAEQQAILVLVRRGWSRRRIARELGVHRETVSRYVKLARGEPTPAHPPPESISKPTIPITGLDERESVAVVATPGVEEPKPAISITGLAGRQSQCAPYREVIVGKLEDGLSAQRIWQDLVSEHGFADGYQSVQRFVRRLQSKTPLPFRRMEAPPGEEAQGDFGAGAPVIIPEGETLPLGVKTRRRKTHVFRMVLSGSRKEPDRKAEALTAEA